MSKNKQSRVDKEFVPYEIALELKQLQFNEPCIANYTVVPEDNINWFTISEQAVTDNSNIFGSSKNYNTEWFETEGTISAPTFLQAFRWFREKYDLDYYIYRNDDDLINYVKNKGVVDLFKYRCGYSDSTSHPIKGCYTHEEAELECLKKLIEIVKEQTQ